MASGFSPKAPGGGPVRIVLLGRVGAGKSKVARALLGGREPKGECGLCILREGEAAGRSICVVDTPGWDRVSIERTSEKIKNEIIRSVTLCPPGPHALILVLPIANLTDKLSTAELKSACRHMELLSERVWRHTMVLFICDGEIEESTITDKIHKASKLLEKCGGRHYVLRSGDHESQIPGFLQEIDKTLKENCDDIFLPQIYYNLIQKKVPDDLTELKRMYEQREEQLKQEYRKRISECENRTSEETGLGKRRGSFNLIPPNMNQDDQTVDIAAIKNKYRDELLTLVRHYSKPITVLIVAVIGALIGSVGGSAYGVLGAGVGIVIGIIIAILLTLWLIDAMRLARQSSDTLHGIKQRTL